MPTLTPSTAAGPGAASSGSIPTMPSSIVSSKKAASGSSLTPGAKPSVPGGGPAKTPTPNAANGGISKNFPKTATEAKKPIDLNSSKSGKSVAKKLDTIQHPKQAVEKKWDATKATTAKNLDKSQKILDKAGADVIKSAKSQVVDMLDAILVIPEPVLLLTLKGIAELGGRPDYKSYYSLTEIIKKDYVSIVKWMVEEFDMSPVSGKSASYLKQAPSLGATKCAFYVLDKMREIKGEEWFAKNRYKEFKKITMGGKTNFTNQIVLPKMNQYNIETTGLGEKGCQEFGIKNNYTVAEVDRFLPERKKSLYWETYPRSPGHVSVFNAMLDGNTHMGPLTHKIIYKRLRQNVVVVNPIVGIISKATDDVIKQMGIDKIVNLVTHPEQLMYLYLKDLKSKRLL